MKNGELIGKHVFAFNPQDNGGEQLSLITELFANGDPGGVYTNQTFTLQSYCNFATIGMQGVFISPELLRKLADELEDGMREAKSKVE